MTDWDARFKNLPAKELDKVALLRMIECTNGTIQYAYRDQQSYALPWGETIRAMKFSMHCMKYMKIPLKTKSGKEKVITFEPETAQLLKEVRKLYISGFKMGNKEDMDEFFVASEASIRAVGEERILKAKKIVETQIEDIPTAQVDWGLRYIKGFVGWS